MTKERVSVKDVMTQHWIAVDGIKTIAEGLGEIQSERIDAFIINKRDQHDEYGLVLLSDIGKQVLAKGRAPERVNLYEIMSKPLISVQSDMDIRYCTRLFERFGLHVVPVVDDGQVVGVVTYRELVVQGLKSAIH
ncbi:CBS domain-containing protein [Ferrimonas lipolytica]|uniref:CBS domain-containing protein n=1 Tax=Ferrimonas lipolytica TaxID=2724191 RepID=A0A6H1U9Z6_9GAMM|nr:CBS domain-containing protein [Ferrimonas lipolytica]QIZ75854.1 CBS domain-containing protein [Ferrimonas lipolytica]